MYVRLHSYTCMRVLLRRMLCMYLYLVKKMVLYLRTSLSLSSLFLFFYFTHSSYCSCLPPSLTATLLLILHLTSLPPFREGHLSVAQLLLLHGARVNVPSGSENNIPLTLACWKGHRDVVHLLLKHKSNIEHQNKAGCTPLMLAAR